MKIITTVGVSIFSNSETSNARLEKTTYDEKYFQKNEIDKIANIVKKEIKDLTDWAINKEGSSASAEITSILKIQEEYKENTPLDIYLICTETILSRLAAEIIKNFFEQTSTDGNKIYPTIFIQEIKVIKKLRVDNQINYDEGFSKLIQYLSEIKHQENDLLNITGGYKALVPILTLYGQLEKLTLKYIYDESSLKDAQLIELGQLPIGIDWGTVEVVKPFLKIMDKTFWTDKKREYAYKIGKGESVIDYKITTEEKEIILYLYTLKLIIPIVIIDKKDESKTKSITTSILGKLVQKVNTLNSYQGQIMEYILYHYFSKENNKQLPRAYQAIAPFQLGGYFKIDDVLNQKIILSESQKDGFRQIGDVDISLKRDNIFVLGESKGLSAFETYYDKLQTKKDYLFQLKARIQKFAEKYSDKFSSNNVQVEVLIIIYNFQFKEFEHSIIEREKVKYLCKHFKKIEQSTDIILENGQIIKPLINFLGLKCLIELKRENWSANFTDFYHKPSLKWETYKS